MITFLDGILDEKQIGRIVINVGGVGYEVAVPLSSLDRLPANGASVRVLIYHHITEASQALFGFMTEEERKMFTLLLGVSGIGPKTAMSALSGLSVNELKTALINSDVKRISSISGIGKKTAERVIVELRDKFTAGSALETMAGGSEFSGDHRLRDAALALEALGYKLDDARKMIKKVDTDPSATVEELIRKALTGK